MLKIFLKNETFEKEKKRLKIVAKWHLNGGLSVPRCRF